MVSTFSRLRSPDRAAARSVPLLSELAAVAEAQLAEGRLEEAAETYERLRRFWPHDPRLLCNLSYLYEQLGRLELAAARAWEAIQLQPHMADAWNNLGMALRERHELSAAEAAFAHAVHLLPGHTLSAFNLATTQLLRGDYAAGWAGYEARCDLLEAPGPAVKLPRWRGQPIAGQTLVVWSDQGLGDAIQFVRFLPEIRARSGAVVRLAAPAALATLLQRIPGSDEVCAVSDIGAAGDWQIPLGSLAGVLGVTLSDLPWRERYLPAFAEPGRATPRPLADARRELHVGLVWQGNPQQGRDFVRSCALRDLLPLSMAPGVRWHSLQVGRNVPEQLRSVAGEWSIADLGGGLRDLAETAAVVERLDLVVTVDTSVAHLAGALGRPVWTLLGHTPDWRYGLTGAACPWYPTMRLFRQPRRGDWCAVAREVAEALVVLRSQG